MMDPFPTQDEDEAAAIAALKPRKRKSQPEHGLSHWVDNFLDDVMLGCCWYTAVETGTWWVGQTPEQRMNAEQKRRARGIKPYALDWQAWQESSGIYAQWELKVEGRPTRAGQDRTMEALRRNNIPCGVFETVPEVCEFLLRAGFHLHGNARNIARLAHERYLASRRADPLAKPAKRSKPRGKAPTGAEKRYKVREEKPSASAVRRTNAVRTRVLF